MCGLMMGGDGTDPFKDEDMDALNEFGNQFMGAVCTALGGRHGVSVSPAQAQTSAFDPAQPPFELWTAPPWPTPDLSIDGVPGLPLPHAPVPRPGLASSPAAAADRMGSTHPATNPLANLRAAYEASLARNLEDSPPNIQMLLDINLNVTIELGRTRLSIRKVLELGPGSIIELDRLAGEPVDLLVNDKVVAKGEVVVVDEYFGIRIISLVSPEERIKQLK